MVSFARMAAANSDANLGVDTVRSDEAADNNAVDPETVGSVLSAPMVPA
jgi:hypothetical protein